MPLLRPINLPTPLILQSLTSVGLGLYLTVFGRTPLLIHGQHAVLVPAQSTPRMVDSIRLLGIVIAALEGNYLVTSYMPFEENQFIASSIPVRLGIAVTLAGLALANRKGMSTTGFWEYVGLAIMDASAAIWLGSKFGRFDGMIPGAEKWLN